MAWCNAFNYDHRETALTNKRNGPTKVEIFETETGKVVLAYTLPFSHKAWCHASATLMTLAEGPDTLKELQEHYSFKPA